jgi:preprotein translocase subunit YajC
MKPPCTVRKFASVSSMVVVILASYTVRMLEFFCYNACQGVSTMPSKKAHAELKVGDKVFIPGEDLRGVVSDVHPHEAVVKLESGEHRKFALESVHRDPTLNEISDFVDH